MKKLEYLIFNYISTKNHIFEEMTIDIIIIQQK